VCMSSQGYKSVKIDWSIPKEWIFAVLVLPNAGFGINRVGVRGGRGSVKRANTANLPWSSMCTETEKQTDINKKSNYIAV